MTKKIGFIMDDITTVNTRKDSTLAMIKASLSKDLQVYYMQTKDMFLDINTPRSMAHLVISMGENYQPHLTNAEHNVNLCDLDLLFMRKDPPFDNEYLYATMLMSKAQSNGTLCVNNPQSLRDYNEKIFATEFSHFMPPTIIASRQDILRNFINEYDDVIIKPLDGMGGKGIFRHRKQDPNLGAILETLTNNEYSHIMVQKYIPDIKNGDKRILVVNGEVVPYCLARIPKIGETRGNLAAGGTGVVQQVTNTNMEIAQEVALTLQKHGIYFAGLDLIGDNLTEINITSPTCIREIDEGANTNIADTLIHSLLQK